MHGARFLICMKILADSAIDSGASPYRAFIECCEANNVRRLRSSTGDNNS